jgi:YHS domain-containing protein
VTALRCFRRGTSAVLSLSRPGCSLPMHSMRPQIHSFLLAGLAAIAGCDNQTVAKLAGEASTPIAAPPVANPPTAAEPPATLAAPDTRRLTRVDDVSQVCMVNDQFMGRAQIPVTVEGKTYFGCCEMCKGRLARDATARVAKDPVSGNGVDKSSAVIAKRDDGQVFYFENAQNFERYRAGAI